MHLLDLSNDSIDEINYGDFAQLPQLCDLNLSKNEIRDIGNASFNGLLRLQYLRLGWNATESLGLDQLINQVKWFHHGSILGNLQWLVMQGNQIERIINDMDSNRTMKLKLRAIDCRQIASKR